MSNMKLGSIGLSIILAMILVIWMASGEVNTAQIDRTDVWEEPVERKVSVEVETLAASPFQPELVIQGQVSAWQQVEVRAQVSGVVELLPVALGQRVSAGDILLRLSQDDRLSTLQQAEARFRQAEADLRGARQLRGNQLISEAEVFRLESELAGAQAQLTAARLAVEHLTPKAPFAGVVDRRHVELGDYVQPGQTLVHLVNTERLKIQGQVPQQSIGNLSEGQTIRAFLADGRHLDARITFVASSAESSTRSFRIEAEADNPHGLRLAGASATLRIALEPRLASYLSPAYLSLNDDGRLGVKHVDGDGRVQFTTVTLLSAGTDGAWVEGLPFETRLITQGGGFVSVGQKVTAVTRRASPDEG
ncbi:MAG: efflux RND transporter periplasmic adaptor subunit [Marinobacter sp.]|nr:efflux RND transporter periplasmic adaptor subunit [Marinobacter sp.]